MNSVSTGRQFKFDYLILLPVLALAFYMAFIPHLNYPYPVHIDEWVHLAYSKAMLAAGSTTFAEPFSGGLALSLSSKLEAGFQLFWGVFQRISGVSWITIFRYFPSVVFMITVLSVYVLGKRMGFGWEAALFTCLIPTTVGIMGPAFLVPVAMGLLFVPLSLFVAFYFETAWSYLVLSIFVCFLMVMHAGSAVLTVTILVPYILLNLKGNFKHGLAMALALAVPFLVTLPLTYNLILNTAQGLFYPQALPPHHDYPQVIREYGSLPIISCLLGTFVLVVKGGVRSYGLVLGLMVMVLLPATFYTLHYGVFILYVRGLLFMMLVMSIVAGAGLMMLRKLELPGIISIKLKKPFIIQTAGIVLSLIFIGVTLSASIPRRQNIPYYHMIGAQDYEAFIWIRDNVDERYDMAILDPWKATAFTAITGKYIYTRIHIAPRGKDKVARDFLASGCEDTDFLKENGITIVYKQEPCSNPDLVEVRKNVYLLKEGGR